MNLKNTIIIGWITELNKLKIRLYVDSWKSLQSVSKYALWVKFRLVILDGISWQMSVRK